MKLNILIPTYNEVENIGKIIPEIFVYAQDVGVVVIDDNSPDGTADVVRTLQKQFSNLQLFSRPKKEGLGAAYLSAFKKYISDSDLMMTMDADFSHHPRYIPALLDAMKNADVVIGSRYVKGGSAVGWELQRRILSRCSNFYVRMITRLPLRDCTSGSILMKTDLLQRINLDSIDLSGYVFLVEIKYLLWKVGARFAEVPIEVVNRLEGKSKLTGHAIKEGILAPWKMVFKK